MKKSISLILAVGMLALCVTACGNKSENVVTEAAVMTEEAQETSAPQFEEGATAEESEVGSETITKKFDASEKYAEYESLFFEGIVTDIEDSILTVENDEEGIKVFDLSGADLDEDEDIYHGCYVEVEYPELEEEPKTIEAITVVILMDAEECADSFGNNPMIVGYIQVADINELQITDIYGNERYFDNGLARTVSFEPLKTGTKVYVSYMGTLDRDLQKNDEDGTGAGTPFSLKIVTEDAIHSEEANVDYVTGIINSIDKNVMYLDNETMSFSFKGDDGFFEGFEENDMVKVYYEGRLQSDKPNVVTKIEKND